MIAADSDSQVITGVNMLNANILARKEIVGLPYKARTH
jgi:hypothetical protein